MQIANIPQNQAQEYARVAQLKQQTAASQQEMQQRQLEMKAQQQQLNDQDALTKTISQFDPAKHSINDVPKMITSNGGSGQKALEAQQSMIAQRQNYLKMSDDQFATEQKKADLFQGVHDAVTNAKPEDKNSVYQQGLHQLSASGIDVSKEPIEYPGDDVFAQHLAPIQLHSAFVEQAAKDRQAAQESAKARLDNAQAAHQEFTNKLTENSKPGDFDKQVDALVPPTGAQGQVQNQFVKGQVNAALSRGDLDSAKKFIDQQYENTLGVNKDIAVQTNPQIQAGKVNVAKATAQAKQDVQNQGAAADQNGNPSQIAQAIANHQMAWKDAVSQRTPIGVKNQILAQVFKIDPNFDTSEFGLEADAAKKARSGQWADTRLAYNTAMDHADQLLAASNALKNGDVQKLNQLKNYFATQFGSSGPVTAQAIANAYNHEVTSVVAKGHMTDAEVAQGHGTLDVNSASPEQIAGVAQAYKNLMSSKRDELDKIIKGTAGNKANSVMNVQSGGGGKTLSMSAIQKAAQDHGVSVDEAKRQAQAAGYTIQ